MSEGYAWPPMGELSGDFLGYTADHLFGEIWNREGLSFRDRRLLLIGLLVGRGLHDVIDIQMEAALKNEELRSEEHTSELQSLMRISYAVFCLKKKNANKKSKQYSISINNL